MGWPSRKKAAAEKDAAAPTKKPVENTAAPSWMLKSLKRKKKKVSKSFGQSEKKLDLPAHDESKVNLVTLLKPYQQANSDQELKPNQSNSEPVVTAPIHEESFKENTKVQSNNNCIETTYENDTKTEKPSKWDWVLSTGVFDSDNKWAFDDEISSTSSTSTSNSNSKLKIKVIDASLRAAAACNKKRERLEISTNFVKLNMRKKFKGRSGNPRKLPTYLRSTKDNDDTKPWEAKKSTSLSLGLRTGVDIITECLNSEKTNVSKSTEDPTEVLPPPKCTEHRRECRIVLVKKRGINKGRKFYSCSLGYKEGKCDFFQWADESPEIASAVFHNDPIVSEETLVLHCTLSELLAKKSSLVTILQVVFGHPSFRNGQEWAIKQTLNYQSSLLVLPTGAGKSLAYLFPALLMHHQSGETGSISVVISPLVSLMADQMTKLPSGMIAVTLSGKQSASETAKVLAQLRNRKVHILFISPERLTSASFIRMATQSRILPPISMVCIDEAHCVSEWSHNFRPAYLKLTSVLRNILNVNTILALTATASKRVCNEICEMLEIKNVFHSNWHRDNLKLCVFKTTEDDRERHLIHLLKTSPFNKGCVIIYVHQKMHADAVTSLLKAEGIRAAAYHGGLDAEVRHRVQEKFIGGKNLRVVVATISFGMGVDKKNVRGVIHLYMPSSLEHFVQEIGRAGRDNKSSNCLLFLVPDDFKRFHSLAHSSGVELLNIRRMVEFLFSSSVESDLTIPISWFETYCDMPAAVIETLLTMLYKEKFIVLRPSLCSTAVLKIPSRAYQRVKCHSFVSVISSSSSDWVSKEVVQDGYLGHTTYKFNLLSCVKAALPKHESLVDLIPSVVISPLRELQNSGLGITYTLEDYSFCLTKTHNGDDDWNTNIIATQLYEKSVALERINVNRSITVFKTLEAASVPHKTAVSYLSKNHRPEEKIAQQVENKIKTLNSTVTNYFEEAQEAEQNTDDDIIESLFPKLSVEKRQRILNDIESLKTDSRVDTTYITPRAIARILHRIPSPRFPSSDWRESALWGKYANDVAFESLMELAT